MGSQKQTHCKRGHEFTPENTYLMGRGELPSWRCCRACKRIKAAEWYQKDKRQYRKSSREKNYGSGAWMHYQGQLEKQNHRCAICGIHEDELGHALSQDHDHNNHNLRGLLCDNCNQAIGKLRENPVIVASALDYILGWLDKIVEVEKCQRQ